MTARSAFPVARIPASLGRMRAGAVILLVGAMLAFHIGRLEDGHSWNDDFALYILHARNLVEGRPYAETGYIYNPARPSLSPVAYPPGFPALLAPVYRVFGLNLTAMKLEIVLFFVASLLVLLRLLPRELPFWYRLAVIGIVGFHPVFSAWMKQVLSDLPFTFWAFLSLLAIEWSHADNATANEQTWRGVLAGLCVYLATATRTIGIVLIPSALGYDLIRHRRFTRVSLSVTVIPLALYGIQTFALLPLESGYGGQLRDISAAGRLGADPQAMFGKIFGYASAIVSLWHNGFDSTFTRGLFGITALLALLGFATRVVQQPSSLELFFIAYLGAQLLWPFEQLKYLIPVIPLYMFYVVYGARQVEGRLGVKPGILLFLILAATTATYAARYTRVNLSPTPERIGSPATQDIFRYVREHTGPTDVFIFRKPRALTLFTGRPASVYHEGEDDELLRYFRQIAATYMLVGPGTMSEPLSALIQRNPHAFVFVYANGEYELFRIVS